MSAQIPWRQVALITLGAGALLMAFDLLPAGSSLNHMDFLADKATVLQLCDPLNTRPLPTAAGRPAVTMAFATALPGEEAFTLTTVSGKTIGAEDLLPRGHPRVQLRVGGLPVAAAPGRKSGEWFFPFAATEKGPVHVVAEFTPAAVGTEMKAEADLN